MEVVVVLSVLLIYLLLTINKGIPSEKRQKEKDEVVEIGKKQLIKKCLLSQEWNVVFQARRAFIGRLSGNAMRARGLFKNDFIIAKPYDRDRSLLKSGDLIIVRSEDEGMALPKYAISEFACELENGLIETVNYDEFNPVVSRKRRSRDIVAVVSSHIRSEVLKHIPVLAN